ncbi:hypothetical protein GYMLUDRAFT_238949 [Collybiopsis luxurians FD-317 M1]|nr:hypothetical protein GYMLUDRAFT_238949 [Collybiopsis luxurians FD-317 M1]
MNPGAFVIIFGLYIYLQVQRQGRQYYYQVSILLLFLLSTAAVAISIVTFVKLALITLFAATPNPSTAPDALPSIEIEHERLSVALRSIYAVANVIADTLLLYRCYIMLTGRKWVIIGSVMISAINTGMAIASVVVVENTFKTAFSLSINQVSVQTGPSFFYAFLGVNLLTNLMLTGFLAGRIWWFSRSTRKYFGYDSSNNRRMTNIASMVLESGLLYPLALVLCIIALASVPFTDGISPSVEPLLTVIVGIAPTMIMVRVDLGASIETPSSADPDNDCKRFGTTSAFPASGSSVS